MAKKPTFTWRHW